MQGQCIDLPLHAVPWPLYSSRTTNYGQWAVYLFSCLWFYQSRDSDASWWGRSLSLSMVTHLILSCAFLAWVGSGAGSSGGTYGSVLLDRDFIEPVSLRVSGVPTGVMKGEPETWSPTEFSHRIGRSSYFGVGWVGAGPGWVNNGINVVQFRR